MESSELDSNGLGGFPVEAVGEGVKPEQQRAVSPKKSRKPKKSNPQANDGGVSSMDTTYPPLTCREEDDDDADGQDQHHHHKQQGGKRPRLVWTTELHARFVKAYNSLGEDAVPKKILEKMNVRGVTREHVASHLQKYRLTLKPEEQRIGRRGGAQGPLGAQASAQMPPPPLLHVLTEAPAASHPPSSIPPHVSLLNLEVCQAQQVPSHHLLHVQGQAPSDCSTSISSSIANDLHVAQSPPLEEGQAAPVAEPPQAAPAASILGKYWASQNTEAFGSWDIFRARLVERDGIAGHLG